MTIKTAYVEVRSQHSVGGSKGFGGPDTYVAVQIVPPGVARLRALQRHVAIARGITIKYFGEGYSKNQATERSMLGRALARARGYADRYNAANDQRFDWAVHHAE